LENREPHLERANVGQRVGAYIIDHFLAQIVGTLILALIMRVLMTSGLYGVVALVFPRVGPPPVDVNALWASYSFFEQLRVLAFLIAVPRWTYMTVFQGSRWHATPGKMLLGLKLNNVSGSAPGYGTSALRSLCRGLLYVCTLGLSGVVNIFLIAKTPKRQALHDLIVHTEVVRAMRDQSA
jgi:uncharacterized RDD family membrane protein YckC